MICKYCHSEDTSLLDTRTHHNFDLECIHTYLWGCSECGLISEKRDAKRAENDNIKVSYNDGIWSVHWSELPHPPHWDPTGERYGW